MKALGQFSDEDFRKSITGAMRLVVIAALVTAPLIWWKGSWRSALLLMIGAAISATGLFEWLRLMTAVMAQMDGGRAARPMALVLTAFFLRLFVVVAVLYVSLKFLGGSVFALAFGLILGVLALAIEGLKLINDWTA